MTEEELQEAQQEYLNQIVYQMALAERIAKGDMSAKTEYEALVNNPVNIIK